MTIHDEPELADLDATQPCQPTQPIRTIGAERLPDVVILPRIGRFSDDEIECISIEIARLFERKAKRKANIWAHIREALGL